RKSGKPSRLIVSCRCTRRTTRDFRSRSIRVIMRFRDASNNFCLIIGCSAESMKNNQKISIFIPSYLTRSRLPSPFEIVLIRLHPSSHRPLDKESTQEHASDESTDMCPKSDSPNLLRIGQHRRPTE